MESILPRKQKTSFTHIGYSIEPANVSTWRGLHVIAPNFIGWWGAFRRKAVCENLSPLWVTEKRTTYVEKDPSGRGPFGSLRHHAEREPFLRPAGGPAPWSKNPGRGKLHSGRRGHASDLRESALSSSSTRIVTSRRSRLSPSRTDHRRPTSSYCPSFAGDEKAVRGSLDQRRASRRVVPDCCLFRGQSSRYRARRLTLPI